MMSSRRVLPILSRQSLPRKLGPENVSARSLKIAVRQNMVAVQMARVLLKVHSTKVVPFPRLVKTPNLVVVPMVFLQPRAATTKDVPSHNVPKHCSDVVQTSSHQLRARTMKAVLN